MRKTTCVASSCGIVRLCSLGLLSLALLAGCGHSPPTVQYASDSLYRGNPIQRIAVFSSANVYWPRTGSKQAVIDVKASMECQEKLLAMVKATLSQRGYAVGATVPVGVAFVDPHIDYSGFQYVGPDGSDVPWTTMAPVFEYPSLRSNPNFERAVRDFIEPLNAAIKEGRLPTHQPLPAAVKFIGQTIDPGADTLCYLRAIGDKYSAARKFGAAMFSRYGGGLSDDLFASLMCVQVESGAVLWRDYVVNYGEDPVTPSLQDVATMTQYLPPRGYSMNPQVVRADGGPVQGPLAAPSAAASGPAPVAASAP